MPPLRVLIVDDEPAVARALRRLLTRRGHHVQIASGVREARAMAAAAPPQVVVADLHLADGNGAELLAELEARIPGLGAVLTTGDSRPDAGYAVLSKPFVPARLDAVLARVAPDAA